MHQRAQRESDPASCFLPPVSSQWSDDNMNEPRKLPYVPGKPDAEVDSELRFHLDERIQANIAAGMSPDEARRAAVERFGDVESVREECARLLTVERKTQRRRD